MNKCRASAEGVGSRFRASEFFAGDLRLVEHGRLLSATTDGGSGFYTCPVG